LKGDENFLDNFVKGMITQILNVSSFTTEIASLKTTIQSFNTDVFSTILDVVKSTTFAIGAALLTLFMLMEFVGMVNRYNSDGGITGIKLPANIMIKFGIISFLFCNFYKVLMGMQGIGVELCNGLVTKFGGDPNITMNTYSLVTQISDIINNFDIINKIIIIIILIIIWIAVQGIMIIIKCTVYFRLFETYLLFIFSPIPLSTIPSNEFRSVGINFLKSFAALSIQGAVIIASFFNR
jgi:hypothetical protein